MHSSKKLPLWAQHKVVMHIFVTAEKLGGEARIVGGAVRDWLLGRTVGDIDMAVNLPIQIMADELRKIQHFKVVNTGLDHGTVTVLDCTKSIELTQTRSDVVTDGRHAVVQFQSDWEQDAVRRDFTINAIYLDAKGNIFDPLAGRADLVVQRVRFIGRASNRVKEDALRLLRYCRFCIDYSYGQHDREAVQALHAFAPLAADLSGERVAQELGKILSNKYCASALRLFHESALDRSTLGIELDTSALPPAPDDLSLVTADYGWLVVFSAMIPRRELEKVLWRLRLSRAARKFCTQLVTSSTPEVFADLSAAHWRQSAFFMHGRAAPVYACAAWRLGKGFQPHRYRQLQHWQLPKLPLSGADLLSHGVDNGRALGQMLDRAKTLWVQSNFTLGKSALLDAVMNRQM